MPVLQFYERPVVLNSQKHRDLKLKPSGEGLKFSAKANSVGLAGTEFAEACKHFPIVFAKAGKSGLLPMAMLGFRNEENLFVDAQGRWKCEYVPAFIRRYPFVLARTGAEANFRVCVDEAFPGFNTESGEALFDAKAEPTKFLKDILTFLKDYQSHLERTEKFLQRLRDFALLTDVSANVRLPSGARYSITGLMMVDERKLLALPESKAMQIFRSGELAWVYSHLLSIGNFNRLLAKAPPQGAAAAGERVEASKAQEKAPLGKGPLGRKSYEPSTQSRK